MKNITTKIIKKIPEDWLFKLVSSTMTTTLTFYLFQFANRIDFIQDLWDNSEKNFIRTFLVLQVLVGAFFYVILKALFIKLYSNLIVEKFAKITGKLDVSDLREVSKFKSFLVDIFDLKIIDANELTPLENLAFEKDEIIKEITGDLSKWTSLFVQVTIVTILVYHLSAWYILPLLVAAVILIALFGIAVSVFLHSIPLLNKIRCELISKQGSRNTIE